MGVMYQGHFSFCNGRDVMGVMDLRIALKQRNDEELIRVLMRQSNRLIPEKVNLEKRGGRILLREHAP